ncbi:MAG: hypothetical protein ACM3XM_07255 [Mycobacterium leprae]
MAEPTKAAEACQEVLKTGNDLLGILQEPGAAQRLPEIQRLLARRQAALDSAGTVPAELVTPLKEQQTALEVLMKRTMDDLVLVMREAQATRTNLDSFHRLLQSGTRSRLLDQRR